MGLAAPLAIVVAALCGLGGCAVAHRFLHRSRASGAHCGSPANAQGWRRIVPLLVTALGCGAIMYAVLSLAPPP